MRDYLSELPEWMREEISRYLETGYMSSDFLTAVFANDLGEAYSRGDEGSIAALPVLIRYIYNCTPMSCNGSYEKVKAWRTKARANETELEEDLHISEGWRRVIEDYKQPDEADKWEEETNDRQHN